MQQTLAYTLDYHFQLQQW